MFKNDYKTYRTKEQCVNAHVTGSIMSHEYSNHVKRLTKPSSRDRKNRPPSLNLRCASALAFLTNISNF